MKTDALSNAEKYAREYRTYRDLPPLAGLGCFPDAVKSGLSVEESVRRLKIHHYALKRLHQIFIARLTAEPIYELKMAFSYHSWLCSEHVAAIRARVGEMREPPLGLDKVPHAALELFFNEIQAAPNTECLLLGLFEVALPAIIDGLERHRSETHVLADQPTRRLLGQCRLELQEMLDYGHRAISALVEPEHRSQFAEVRGILNQCLSSAGVLDGASPANVKLPAPHWSATPIKYDSRPRRDERFPDPYNMGVNAEVFLYDNSKPLDGKVLMMFYKRIREIDVPEMMASIIAETPDKPWGYYRDLTRQLWDEARHAMMGEVGFVSLGIEWPQKVMVNSTWSTGLNSQLTPKERHAVLYFIEQGLMPKTGKRHEWEVGVMSKNPLAATFQDFDWADEVLHARVGRDWYVSDMPSAHEAVAFGDRCWSKVLLDWNAWRASGVTEHRNWWPGLYTQYCERNHLKPDPTALAYSTSYESVRADLKDISASA